MKTIVQLKLQRQAEIVYSELPRLLDSLYAFDPHRTDDPCMTVDEAARTLQEALEYLANAHGLRI